jgi:hypothetical protein
MAPEAAQRKAGLDRMIGQMSKTDVDEAVDGYTLGWDIVVTYSEKEINDILKRKWEKARKVRTLGPRHDICDSQDV